MIRFAVFTVSLLLSAGAASANEPIGDWMVEDGSAHIRIVNCSGALWGVVSWEKKPGVDADNPDPAKRSRPTLGMPILLDMKPVNATKWGGEVYNAQNGKTYKASITSLSPDSLRIEGCVLGGIFCGGEKWTRVAAPPPPPQQPKPQAKSPSKSEPKSETSNLSASVCSRLSGIPGLSHQSRLK